jgi:hypothetical protein
VTIYLYFIENISLKKKKKNAEEKKRRTKGLFVMRRKMHVFVDSAMSLIVTLAPYYTLRLIFVEKRRGRGGEGGKGAKKEPQEEGAK